MKLYNERIRGGIWKKFLIPAETIDVDANSSSVKKGSCRRYKPSGYGQTVTRLSQEKKTKASLCLLLLETENQVAQTNDNSGTDNNQDMKPIEV